jgi:hypothetical protein
MIAASHDLEDLSLDHGPLAEHLSVACPHHEIPEREQRPIPSTVCLEVAWAVVPCLPVELEHQPVSDHEVDVPDSRDLDLRRDPQPTAPQGQPGDGLES